MLYQRSDWGGLPSKRQLSSGAPGDGFTVHHVGEGRPALTTVQAAMAVLRGIQIGHLNHPDEDYSDIAYNAAVDQLGNVYVLRGMDRLGGATFGHNDHVRACLWIGDSNVSNPSDAALRALAGVYTDAVSAGHLVNGAAIGGHRDWSASACPGDRLYGYLPTIRALAAGQAIDLEGEDMTDEERRMLVAIHGAVATTYAPFGRPANSNDVMHGLGTRLAEIEQGITARLTSIEPRVGAVESGQLPTADEIAAAIIRQLKGAP